MTLADFADRLDRAGTYEIIKLLVAVNDLLLPLLPRPKPYVRRWRGWREARAYRHRARRLIAA